MEEAIGSLFGMLIVLFIFIPVIAGIFHAPTLIAIHKNHPQTFQICLVNITVGWTGIGWVVALIWSFRKTDS